MLEILCQRSSQFQIRVGIHKIVFFSKKTYCGNSLEAPRWGTSDEYTQHTFSQENKKNINCFFLLKKNCLFWNYVRLFYFTFVASWLFFPEAFNRAFNNVSCNLKASYSSKTDILFYKLIYGIITISKCGTWQPVKFQLGSRSWTGSKMKWFFIISLN